MSLTSIRRKAPSLNGLSRHYSTPTRKGNAPKPSLKSSSSKSVPSHTTLPPAKIRALIALYHQADSWVTPQNLAEKINEAFVPQRNQMMSISDPSFNAKQGRIDIGDLEKARYNIEVAPKMAQWDRHHGVGTTANSSWGLSASKRELKVIEALYGVSTTPRGELLPGLSVVEEAAPILDRGNNIFEKEK